MSRSPPQAAHCDKITTPMDIIPLSQLFSLFFLYIFLMLYVFFISPAVDYHQIPENTGKYSFP